MTRVEAIASSESTYLQMHRSKILGRKSTHVDVLLLIFFVLLLLHKRIELGVIRGMLFHQLLLKQKHMQRRET